MSTAQAYRQFAGLVHCVGHRHAQFAEQGAVHAADDHLRLQARPLWHIRQGQLSAQGVPGVVPVSPVLKIQPVRLEIPRLHPYHLPPPQGGKVGKEARFRHAGPIDAGRIDAVGWDDFTVDIPAGGIGLYHHTASCPSQLHRVFELR